MNHSPTDPSQKRSAAAGLSRLTHHRWALPTLAYVAENGGCKLVALSRHLGASPAGLKRALGSLAELGLVIRNPGYGHPLRPEYILGPVGEHTDGLPSAILTWTEQPALSAAVLKKWSLPVLVALSAQTSRFGDVRRELVSASPRALTLALKSNAALGLITREVELGYPPTPRYTPTPLAQQGREPARLLGLLLA